MSIPPARIAVMLPRLSRYGGVEQFAYRLSEGLAARGHTVDFLCARAETEAPQGVNARVLGRVGGVQVLKMLWFLARAETARRKGGYDLAISLGKTWNQDLLRVGGGPLRVFWPLSSRAWPPGLPRLLKAVRRHLSPANWLTLLLERRQFSGRSKVVAVSHLVRDWICTAHPGLSPDCIDIVYNRPDLGRYHPCDADAQAAARAMLGLGEGDFAIGVATTNFELKGIGPLISALALLPSHMHLMVAGGRGTGRYLRFAQEKGVAERVHFLGKVQDMPGFYHGLDLFILPTFYDACSNAVLEAMACGLRVLTSTMNGAAYFLPEQQRLADPGDAVLLAEKISWLAASPAPPPFAWPEATPAGLDAFIQVAESMVRQKTGAHMGCAE